MSTITMEELEVETLELLPERATLLVVGPTFGPALVGPNINVALALNMASPGAIAGAAAIQ
jgi:hypothetical protein